MSVVYQLVRLAVSLFACNVPSELLRVARPLLRISVWFGILISVDHYSGSQIKKVPVLFL